MCVCDSLVLVVSCYCVQPVEKKELVLLCVALAGPAES